MIPVLIITGSLGSGKTAVLGEASDILRERNINAAIGSGCPEHPAPASAW